jgi:hypothetical protein
VVKALFWQERTAGQRMSAHDSPDGGLLMRICLICMAKQKQGIARDGGSQFFLTNDEAAIAQGMTLEHPGQKHKEAGEAWSLI